MLGAFILHPIRSHHLRPLQARVSAFVRYSRFVHDYIFL